MAQQQQSVDADQLARTCSDILARAVPQLCGTLTRHLDERFDASRATSRRSRATTTFKLQSKNNYDCSDNLQILEEQLRFLRQPSNSSGKATIATEHLQIPDEKQRFSRKHTNSLGKAPTSRFLREPVNSIGKAAIPRLTLYNLDHLPCCSSMCMMFFFSEFLLSEDLLH